MRQIVLDTETTGLNAKLGDRVIEIACVEMINRRLTGKHFHCYVNPEREIDEGALKVHGITLEFLADKPKFAEKADEFLTFIADDTLVIHNAAFDIGFLNAELVRAGRPAIARDRVIDTLALARRKHPGGPNSLDVLMSRYGIDSSKRVKHGALLDAELLAEVYSELLGGRQAMLVGLVDEENAAPRLLSGEKIIARQRPAPLPPLLTADEWAAHVTFIAEMGEKAIWTSYAAPVAEAPPKA
jgi:DNA polymerase-3 subunit epsilon